MRHRYKHKLSRNASAETPLAIEYRLAKERYHEAGAALRSSCADNAETCGFSKAPAGRLKQFRFFAPSADAMESEFLRAPAPGGTNEDVIRAAIGHLSVKDPTEWEPIAERYETGPLATFSDAFAVLAKAAKGSKRKPDWRKLDIDTLRSCPGLSDLQMPEWMLEASTQQEEAARYYGRYSDEVPF